MIHKDIRITHNNQTLILHFRQYAHYQNLAIKVSESNGMPYSHLTTNPEFQLPRRIVCIRNDREYNHPLRDRLVELGILENTTDQIQVGLVTGTLYKVLEDLS